ncbi:hypothetical protein ABK040_005628 [Willaertia magna]
MKRKNFENSSSSVDQQQQQTRMQQEGEQQQQQPSEEVSSIISNDDDDNFNKPPIENTTSNYSRGHGGRGRGGRGRGGGGGYHQRSNSYNKKQKHFKHALEQLFDQYATLLDMNNDKKERIYKASRDVTIESKRLVFLLQRYSPKTNNKEEILNEAKEKIEMIVKEYLSIVKKEIDEKSDEYFWKYARSYSFGLQELIEGISFYYFIKDGSLITLEALQSEINFQVSPLDYLLGIADLTGELMRLATTNFNVEEIPKQILSFMNEMYSNFLDIMTSAKGLSPYEEKDLKTKLDIMETSLSKVEKICYAIVLQQNDRFKRPLIISQ